MSLEKIYTSTPIDKTAAIVTSEAQHYDLNFAYDKYESTVCPQLTNKKGNIKDYTGKKYGRFTVIGLFQRKKKRLSLWVVKCSCGTYTLRRAVTIQKGLCGFVKPNLNNMCTKCFKGVILKTKASKILYKRRRSGRCIQEG